MKGRLLVYSVVLLAALGYLQWRARAPASLEITVVRENLVAYRGQAMSLDELDGAIAADLRSGRPTKVVVTVDGHAPSTVLIPVLDLLERSGAADVQVIAEP